MGVHSIDAEDDQFAYRYDTQLLIERRDQDLVKIHFHTNEPWKILEYCNSIGDIFDIAGSGRTQCSRTSPFPASGMCSDLVQ